MAKNLLIKNPVERSLYLSRGVPHYVLFGSFPQHYTSAIERIEIQRDDGMKTFKPSTQHQIINDTIEKPLKNNYLYAIGGKRGDELAAQLALRFMKAAFDINKLGTGGRPYWHVLDGSTRDKLRDEGDFKEVQVGAVSMLIISNIAANSTAMKIEKLRDLLVKYSHVPRIVILSGVEPFTYFTETLYMKPTRVLYFGSGRSE